MKCVKASDGSIQRLSDKKAAEAVRSGASYCAKKHWKSARKKPEKKTEKQADKA